MFRLTEQSSGEIQNIVLVWNTIICALTECTSTMFRIWPDDGSVGRNMSPNLKYF